jgi:diaminopimelate decarboxylase
MLTGMKIGDYLLIGACGAYDMSMHYEFGNAKERDIEVTV